MATVALLVPVLAWAARRVCVGYAPSAPRLKVFVAATALVAVIGLWTSSDVIDLSAGLTLGFLLLVLAIIDFHIMRLPNPLTFAMAVAGLAYVLIARQPLLPHLIGGVAGYGVMALIAEGYHRLRGRRGLGLGDAKLMGAAGLWLGWRILPVVVLCACAGGLLWATWLALTKRGFDRAAPIAFGPALCLSIWLCWLMN